MIVCLVGPTASGKSELSMQLAESLGAEIISADSALVYRGMNIGTAKPSHADRARVPHWLIDTREPTEAYSAADFVSDAESAIADIQARGRIALVVGGTLLYVRALLQGLSTLPPADPKLRTVLASELQTRGAAELHAELGRVDPTAAARIHPNDSQRLLRALEVYRQTGNAISSLQGAWKAAPRRTGLLLGLIPADRALLHTRIAARLDAMIAAGFLDEVRALMAVPGMHDDLPAMRAVGYRQALGHLRGEYGQDRFRELALYATRQLAKRQLTWLRGEPDLNVFDPAGAEALNCMLTRIRSALDQSH